MSTVLPFPIDIRYNVFGINRDGRIIVEIINTSKRFMMHAETLLATPYLIRKFPKDQVQWLSDVAAMNRKDRHDKGTNNSHLNRR